MQKKLIALAVAGLASTGALAQANVTVYGVADASFDVVRISGDANNELGNTTRVSTNSSLLGFKGAESLGNGLTAVFQYESSVGFDNAGALGATRDSYVGLAGGFGTVVLGNLTGPTRALGSAVDVNAGATGIGANTALIGKLGNNLLGTTDTSGNYAGGSTCARNSTCASIFDTRWKNAIAYVSPSFGGLNATVAYVANENKALNGLAAANTTGYDVGVKYANGPAMAAVTYNAVSVGNAADLKVSDLRVGGSYNFGMASVRALFDLARADNFGGNKVTQAVYGFGATFNVTPASKLLGQVYVARDLKVNGSSSDDTGAKLFEIGVEHSLSKRTMLKATYAMINNDKAATYDFGINAAGIRTGALPGGANAVGGTVSGLSFGLRHTF
ncbi:porin [Zoogloea sp.]|jgi:predicted porin|uniref:porin n=2 Tax=Zoogloea sp. TaxID=49181 RepID=UPI0011D339ED|nr:porin [Zoogloea sp.]MBK6653582.1 porin [Zoogloea sp.]MBP7445935.1 porin [Zoogloea sp.]TXG95239.1 MAG: porin [Zoogloea sp.]